MDLEKIAARYGTLQDRNRRIAEQASRDNQLDQARIVLERAWALYQDYVYRGQEDEALAHLAEAFAAVYAKRILDLERGLN